MGLPLRDYATWATRGRVPYREALIAEPWIIEVLTYTGIRIGNFTKHSPEYLATIHWYGHRPVDATTLLQLHNENSWLFSSPCNTISLVLKIREKERYGESPQKARGRQNLMFFTKVSEPSFQVVWPCKVILSDIWRFKLCLCNASTKYR